MEVSNSNLRGQFAPNRQLPIDPKPEKHPIIWQPYQKQRRPLIGKIEPSDPDPVTFGPQKQKHQNDHLVQSCEM